MTAIRMVHTDELRERIDNERLDAAEMEFARHDRVRRVTVEIIAQAERELRAMADGAFAAKQQDLRTIADCLDSVAELLRGEWLRSPRTMAAEREKQK